MEGRKPWSASSAYSRASIAWPLICSCCWASGHAQLPFHQVQAGDQLGHRVLHLQPGVHFHEVERAIRGGNELHRAGADIAHRPRRVHRRCAHRRTALFGHPGGRGFLQHLLVTALHRAVALEQVDHVAVAVGKYLDFDMARAEHVLFHQHLVIAEGIGGLAPAAGQGGGKVGRTVDPAHALATTTGAGLDQHRVADGIGLLLQQGGVLAVAVVARRERHARRAHQRLGRALGAHRFDGLGRRADEGDPGLRTVAGEAGVLGQKAVAGVDGLGTAGMGGGNDRLATQVAFGGRGRADVHGFIGQAHMAGIGIGIGIHRHGGNPQAAAGGDDAAGNFATVGDQYLGKHQLGKRGSGRHRLTSGTRRSRWLRPGH